MARRPSSEDAGKATRESSRRLPGVAELVDRYFAIAWIGIYVLLPVSGWASEMFESWADQRRDLQALRSLIETGQATSIASNAVGSGYLGAAALVHEIFRLSPENSLVVLTRVSYVLSVAAALVLVRVVVRRMTPAPPMVTLVAQLFLLALVIASGTWLWSDVPWSHFFAMFLVVAWLVVRFVTPQPGALQAAVAGVLLGLLAATRTFEFIALLLAWLIVSACFAGLRLSSWLSWSARRLAAAVAGFVVTTLVVYLATGKHDPFFLYGGTLDQQPADIGGGEVAGVPTFSFGLLPVKLVQLFVEPCYMSLCSVSDYDLQGRTSLDFWSPPLLVQLPALALLPLCIVGVAFLVVRAVRRRGIGSTSRELALLAEMTVMAYGLVVGYAASTMTGPSHLRYGFARDFLLPALLTAIVATSLGAIWLWRVLARRGLSRFSPEAAFVVCALGAIAVAAGATALGRTRGLPRIESRQLASVTYTADCSGHACDVGVSATSESGGSVSIPSASRLTFGCRGTQSSVDLYLADLGTSVSLPGSCVDPRLVSAWPTVMGLPPGLRELQAVSVVNEG